MNSPNTCDNGGDILVTEEEVQNNQDQDQVEVVQPTMENELEVGVTGNVVEVEEEEGNSPKNEETDSKEDVTEVENEGENKDNNEEMTKDEEKPKSYPEPQVIEEEARGLDALLNNKLQTISTYMSLVTNKQKQCLLLQESTVTGFLVLSLGDEDPEVVERSFEVFFALSKSPENLPLLQKVDYFMDALRCVKRNAEVSEQTRTDAKSLYSELKNLKPNKENDHQPLSEMSASDKNVLASNLSTLAGNSNAPAEATVVDAKAVPVPKAPVDLNTTMSTMKRKNKGVETILFIENDVIQQKTERAQVTQVLIGVKGIISVTYDLKKNHCIVRGKRMVPPETFGRAVASLGLANVYLVRKNEKKEEIKIPIVAGDKENVQYPAYPEELENEDIDTSTSVARTDQPRAEGTSSIFKSAKNFIKRSFYW